jgi:hypothetical protein
MVQIKIGIPIVCENDKCPKHGNLINSISEINVQDLELFYEDYGHNSYKEDCCQFCGQLGIVQEAYFVNELS